MHNESVKGGRLVVPAEIRKALGIRDGDTVLGQLEDGAARLATPRERLRHAREPPRRHVPAGV